MTIASGDQCAQLLFHFRRPDLLRLVDWNARCHSHFFYRRETYFLSPATRAVRLREDPQNLEVRF